MLSNLFVVSVNMLQVALTDPLGKGEPVLGAGDSFALSSLPVEPLVKPRNQQGISTFLRKTIKETFSLCNAESLYEPSKSEIETNTPTYVKQSFVFLARERKNLLVIVFMCKHHACVCRCNVRPDAMHLKHLML